MNALYAMARITDDIADGPGLAATRRLALTQWKTDLRLALSGKPTHPIHPALCHIINRYGIPPDYFFDLIAGCLQDVFPEPFRSIKELQQYCYRVSCTIGLSCVRIWGLQSGVAWSQVEPAALEAGYAFQLTNIIRDIAEDARAGRVYVPQEELAQFDVSPPAWTASPRFPEFINWQIERIEGHYSKAETLTPLLSTEGQAIFRLMMRAYRELAERLRKAGPRLLHRRIRLSAWQKLKLFLAAR